MADWTSTALRAAKGELLGGSLAAGIGVAGAVFDYGARVRGGENPFTASLHAGSSAALFLLMGSGPASLVPMGFMLGKAGMEAGYAFNQQMNTYMRHVKQPFSHSFVHSDVTMAAQQRGLAALGQGRGMVGSEAGMFNSLYGRR